MNSEYSIIKAAIYIYIYFDKHNWHEQVTIFTEFLAFALGEDRTYIRASIIQILTSIQETHWMDVVNRTKGGKGEPVITHFEHAGVKP